MFFSVSIDGKHSRCSSDRTATGGWPTGNVIETRYCSYAQHISVHIAAEGIGSDLLPPSENSMNAMPPLDFVFGESRAQENLTENQSMKKRKLKIPL